jgi:hypothetical protein
VAVWVWQANRLRLRRLMAAARKAPA